MLYSGNFSSYTNQRYRPETTQSSTKITTRFHSDHPSITFTNQLFLRKYTSTNSAASSPISLFVGIQSYTSSPGGRHKLGNYPTVSSNDHSQSQTLLAIRGRQTLGPGGSKNNGLEPPGPRVSLRATKPDPARSNVPLPFLTTSGTRLGIRIVEL